MRFFKVILFLLSVSLLSTSYAKDEEIIVCLSSAKPLMPLYISPMQNDNSDFSSDYLTMLKGVLRFDLHYNGSTKVVDLKKKVEGCDVFGEKLDFAKLKEQELFYLVRLKSKAKEIIAQVISINGQEARQIDNIFLTGDLAKDRLKMHQLADAIHQMLFVKPGVASSKILFTVKKKNAKGDIVSDVFESDYDGYNMRQITKENALCANPSYMPPLKGSAEGITSCMFVSYKIGQPKIYVANLRTGQIKRLTEIKANQMTPSMSKDGTTLGFACDIMGTSDLFIQNMGPNETTTGKPQQVFRFKGAAQASPVFSPNGVQFAFVSNKDGTPRIYVMDVPKPGQKFDAKNAKMISKKCRENSAPSWSPDGKKIAFTAKSTGERQIWVYDFESNQEWQLTDGTGTKENPSWAKDSCHLLFNSTAKGATEIYLVNLNQPESVKISQGTGDKMFPAWSP